MFRFLNIFGHIFIGFGLGTSFFYILIKILSLFGIIERVESISDIISILEIFLSFIVGYTLVLISKANTVKED